MTGDQFLRTMIETIKYDYNVDYKEELLGLLRNSVISFEKTGSYVNRLNYFREYICLRVPIPMLRKCEEFNETLKKLAADVYMEPSDTEQNYEFSGFKIKPKPINLDSDYVKEHTVVFDDIKKEIIQGIRNAKYTIWIAVA